MFESARFMFCYAGSWSSGLPCVRAALSTCIHCLPPCLAMLEKLVCLPGNQVYSKARDVAHYRNFKASFEVDTCAASPSNPQDSRPGHHSTSSSATAPGT
jgi:hypothetical protein